MGVTGVMERAGVLTSVRKAIPLLCAGETWVSRTLVKSLHSQLQYTADDSLFPPAMQPSGYLKN